MKPTAIILLLILLGMPPVMLGCSTYTPYEYQDERDLLPGAGLFSGEDGQFTLVRLPPKPDNETLEETVPGAVGQ
jgi:hypothetical protein